MRTKWKKVTAACYPWERTYELGVLTAVLVLAAWVWHGLSRLAPDLRNYFYLIYLYGLSFYFVRHGAGRLNHLRSLKQLCNVAINSFILLLKKLRLAENRLAQGHRAVHGRAGIQEHLVHSIYYLSTPPPSSICGSSSQYPASPNTSTHAGTHAHTPTPRKGTYLYFWPVSQVKSSCI